MFRIINVFNRGDPERTEEFTEGDQALAEFIAQLANVWGARLERWEAGTPNKVGAWKVCRIYKRYR